MTETIDQLIQARFDAVANVSDHRDWDDVLARARGGESSVRRRRIPTRIALAAAATVLAATATAASFGWPGTVVDFFKAAPAPQSVKDFFSTYDVAVPGGVSPETELGQPRQIMSASFDANHVPADHPTLHTLYVAPRKDGGFCYLWTGYGGGCADPPGTAAYARTHPGARPLGTEWLANDYALLVDGWIRTGATKTIEARFAGGTTAAIPVTWVSAPISAGFFVYPVPLAHQTRADALSSVVALDANGNVVGRQDFRLTPPLNEDVLQTLPDGTKYSLMRRADAARARKVISFRSTKGNEIYLWVMPNKGGGVCYLFNRGEGCTPAGFMAGLPTALNGGLRGGGAPLLFFAQVKPDVAAVELRYQNGESDRLTPVDGFVLTEITPAHYAPGTRLVADIALDKSGQAIYTGHEQPEGVGVYPCQTPKDLGNGVTACP